VSGEPKLPARQSCRTHVATRVSVFHQVIPHRGHVALPTADVLGHARSFNSFARIERETRSYDLSQQRIRGARYVGHNREASAGPDCLLTRARRNSR